MSKRHDLDHHRYSLGEIREIMNAMKTLAYMETRKLSRFIQAQKAVVANIESAAVDFMSFHGDTLPEVQTEITVYLLIGTERGFCGDINQALASQFERVETHAVYGASASLIVIGRKLHQLFENDKRVAAYISGANIAEEVSAVLEEVAQELSILQRKHGTLTLYSIYHSGEDGIKMNMLLPPFKSLNHQQVRYSDPPLLNIPPAEFFLELTDAYVFAALNEMLYTSLIIENRHRMTHLEGAVQHLDEEVIELMRKSNVLRQEEITEEIEVILLSTDSPNIREKTKKTYR
ncbi:F0F1 ATP synthase subunit gamma [Pontibacterium granulatum]|uniref:F0F1 ATP synthase subunit gamma n=1 Tax=Pontibacterium granulatum TaxID=2036029 RepID=UPI00249BDE1F|nr:F0F1 ATP synthase subunit gamma [Pontibacterium granulatum]MDI3325634.1 F0F1 ATP synthase subunit gamma [Pontibacterium granulatum]